MGSALLGALRAFGGLLARWPVGGHSFTSFSASAAGRVSRTANSELCLKIHWQHRSNQTLTCTDMSNAASVVASWVGQGGFSSPSFEQILYHRSDHSKLNLSVVKSVLVTPRWGN